MSDRTDHMWKLIEQNLPVSTVAERTGLASSYIYRLIGEAEVRCFGKRESTRGQQN